MQGGQGCRRALGPEAEAVMHPAALWLCSRLWMRDGRGQRALCAGTHAYSSASSSAAPIMAPSAPAPRPAAPPVAAGAAVVAVVSAAAV
jgi:hypothetical protein